MPSASLPSPDRTQTTNLRAFAERALGPITNIADCSSPRGNSRVWRITAGRQGRTWYLKQHPTAKFHAREVHAYARWAPALGEEQAPLLRAADSGLFAVILTELPGVNPFHHMLPPDEEQEIHRQLGLLLDTLHHCAPRRPPTRTYWALDQVQGHLTVAGPHLEPGDLALIRRMAALLAGQTPLPHFPTHGDMRIRNTIWNPDTRILSLIDFEHAEYGPFVRDLVHLEYGPWQNRPDLKRAFFTAYGPEPTPFETERLQAMAALDALSGIAFGATHNDPEAVSRGRRTLARLHAEALA